MLAMMVVELLISRRHERRLRELGAVEPADDVYKELAWAYPLMFAVMAGEGARGDVRPREWVIAGLLVLALAKALKYWAVVTLGPRWTYRVLVPPNTPLVTGGPYAWVRHPNYAAVFGEIAGFATLVGAPLSGAASLALFGTLVRRRIAVEERALGRRA